MSKYDDYVRTVDAQQAELQDRYNEQERDVGDNEMPVEIWARRDKTWDRVDGFGGAKFVRAARGDEPEQSDMSGEDAQVLEWLRQQRELLLQDESDIYAYRLLRITEDAIDVSFVSELIAEEAANWRDIRYAPPQRPTAESMIAGMRKCKTSDDLWDWWQDTLEDWDAAGQGGE